MDMTLLMQYWAVAALLTLSPGADWAYAISAGLRSRSVLPAIAGMLSGYVVMVSFIAFGAGAIVAGHPLVLTVLTLAGSFYLIYLGLRTLLGEARPLSAEDHLAESGASQYWKGAGISGTNPKALLLLLALLPQFTTPEGWHMSAQLMVLGGVHLLNCGVIYLGVALIGRRLLRSRPRASIVVTRAAGAIMTGIGLALLVSKVVGLA